jgi:hypothetical protein
LPGLIGSSKAELRGWRVVAEAADWQRRVEVSSGTCTSGCRAGSSATCAGGRLGSSKGPGGASPLPIKTALK